MLLIRSISSIIMLLLAMVLFFLPLIQFMMFISIICLISAWEWSNIFNFNKKQKIIWMFILAFLFIFFIFFSFNTYYKQASFYFFNTIIFLSCIWWIISIFFIQYYPKYNFLWIKYNFLCLIFGSCIIIPFFCAILLLKKYEQLYTIGNTNWILYVFLLTCACDSGAYVFGYFFGKHQLAPIISPRKTWEGLLGGIITSVLCNIIYLLIKPVFLDTLTLTTFFVFILLGSILGDLTESMFKRSIGIKDSSNLIPGHGGILDRTDSLMFSFPIFAFILLIFYFIQKFLYV